MYIIYLMNENTLYLVVLGLLHKGAKVAKCTFGVSLLEQHTKHILISKIPCCMVAANTNDKEIRLF
jgi:hypothetical protein